MIACALGAEEKNEITIGSGLPFEHSFIGMDRSGPQIAHLRVRIEWQLASKKDVDEMHLISYKKVRDYIQRHPHTEPALIKWYHEMKRATFSNLPELQAVFPTADLVNDKVVFNVGGNATRVIVRIYFADQVVLIRNVLTHAEYNKGRWK